MIACGMVVEVGCVELGSQVGGGVVGWKVGLKVGLKGGLKIGLKVGLKIGLKVGLKRVGLVVMVMMVVVVWLIRSPPRRQNQWLIHRSHRRCRRGSRMGWYAAFWCGRNRECGRVGRAGLVL